MADAYCHKGLTIEVDVSVPTLTIEGRDIPTEQLAGLFDLSELPSAKTEKLRQYGHELIEGSPGFKKREATQLAQLAILARGVDEWNRWRRRLLRFGRFSMTLISPKRLSLSN